MSKNIDKRLASNCIRVLAIWLLTIVHRNCPVHTMLVLPRGFDWRAPIHGQI